jgi:hypothetical protein
MGKRIISQARDTEVFHTELGDSLQIQTNLSSKITRKI